MNHPPKGARDQAGQQPFETDAQATGAAGDAAPPPWKRRLEKARRLREKAMGRAAAGRGAATAPGPGAGDAPSGDGVDAIPSVEEVLATPNLAERFELASRRHARLAARNANPQDVENRKKAVLYALSGKGGGVVPGGPATASPAPPRPAQPGAAVGTGPDGDEAPGTAGAAQAGEAGRRRRTGLVLAGVVVALVGVVGLVPGPLRDLLAPGPAPTTPVPRAAAPAPAPDASVGASAGASAGAADSPAIARAPTPPGSAATPAATPAATGGEPVAETPEQSAGLTTAQTTAETTAQTGAQTGGETTAETGARAQARPQRGATARGAAAAPPTPSAPGADTARRTADASGDAPAAAPSGDAARATAPEPAGVLAGVSAGVSAVSDAPGGATQTAGGRFPAPAGISDTPRGIAAPDTSPAARSGATALEADPSAQVVARRSAEALAPPARLHGALPPETAPPAGQRATGPGPVSDGGGGVVARLSEAAARQAPEGTGPAAGLPRDFEPPAHPAAAAGPAAPDSGETSALPAVISRSAPAGAVTVRLDAPRRAPGDGAQTPVPVVSTPPFAPVGADKAPAPLATIRATAALAPVPRASTHPPAPSAAQKAESPALRPDLSRYRVTFSAPSGVPDDQLATLMAVLRETGYPVGEPRRVGFRISKSNVRYFYRKDAEAAAVLAHAVGGIVRDFTGFRPRPAEGTIEIWLRGGTAGSRRGAAASKGRGGGRASELQALRNRLIQRLRRGDVVRSK